MGSAPTPIENFFLLISSMCCFAAALEAIEAIIQQIVEGGEIMREREREFWETKSSRIFEHWEERTPDGTCIKDHQWVLCAAAGRKLACFLGMGPNRNQIVSQSPFYIIIIYLFWINGGRNLASK